MCNYMQEVMRPLCPHLVSAVSTVEVEESNLTEVVKCFDDGAHQMFMSAISDELPFGKRYGSTVLDLVVPPQVATISLFLLLRFVSG